MKSVLVLALAILASVPALAQEPQPPTPVVAGAPAVTLTADQFAQLVAKTTAGAAEVQPAAKPATISEVGILGMSWNTIGSILAAILGAVFLFWKGAAATRVQKALPDLMDAAFWFTERNFGDLAGPQKAMVALGKLYEGMTGHGFILDPKAVAAAQTRWQLLAEREKLTAAPVAPPAAQLAQATAAAATSAQVAAGANATELLKQAGG